MAARSTTTRLPTVHPFATVGVFAVDEDRLLRLEQVLLLREKFVVRVEHRPSETFGCKVGIVGKTVTHCHESYYGISRRSRGTLTSVRRFALLLFTLLALTTSACASKPTMHLRRA